jgi:hypothetical protein
MNTLELLERRHELKELIDGLRGEIKDINDQLENAYLDAAKANLAGQGKDFGTTYVMAGNSRLKVVVNKKVTWDQEKLRDVLNSMAPEDARHYGKLTFAVEEAKYKAAPPAVRAQLEGCRTTETGTITFNLVEG